MNYLRVIRTPDTRSPFGWTPESTLEQRAYKLEQSVYPIPTRDIYPPEHFARTQKPALRLGLNIRGIFFEWNSKAVLRFSYSDAGSFMGAKVRSCGMWLSASLCSPLQRGEREAYMAVRGVAGSADYDFWYEIRLSEGRAHFHMGLLHSYDESLDSRFFSLIQYLRRNFLTNTLE